MAHKLSDNAWVAPVWTDDKLLDYMHIQTELYGIVHRINLSPQEIEALTVWWQTLGDREEARGDE